MVWCFSTRASVATVLTTHPCLSRCLWVKCIVSTVSTSHQRMQYTPMTEGAINTLRPRQDGRHFPDDILKWIFLNENLLISIKISLKFVPMGPISNIPALVQIMAWRRPGDKPLSELMMVSSPTHICITRPQWINAGTTKILHKISSTILNNIIWSVQIRFQIVNNYETFCSQHWTNRRLCSIICWAFCSLSEDSVESHKFGENQSMLKIAVTEILIKFNFWSF